MQDIYVDDTGKGKALVLIHGFLGSSDMWKPQIKYFKKNYRVISPALPGFGKSNKLKSCNSIQSMAEAVLDSLKKKHIKRFNLLGHSMGGMIAQEIAKIASDKILKLIFYGTGPIGNIPGRFETMDESIEKLKINGLDSTVYRIAKTWFTKKNKAKYFYLCEEAGRQTTLKTAEDALIAMKNWSGIDNLKNIENETLIIWGNKDRAYNFSQVDTLKKNIKKSSLEIIKGCSHNVHLEDPNKFNMCVEDFLLKL